MNQSIETFNHEQFGILRTVTDESEPLFVAADVCKALGHTNASMALARLDDDEKAKLNLGLPGGDTNVVTFPGLLNLVLGSRKPEAREYKRWVTHVVLPSVHRTGGYIAARADETPEQIMARAVLVAQDTIERQKARIGELERDNADMRPKALFADAVAASDGCVLVGQLAKMLRQAGVEIGQNRLFEWMRENGYLGKSGSNYNVPLQRFVEQGLFRVKETAVTHADGHVTLSLTTKVTGKGQRYFMDRFLAV